MLTRIRVPKQLASVRWSQRRRLHQQLKDYLSSPLPKTHRPSAVEFFWSQQWSTLETAEDPQKPRFTLLFPPPNVTGTLHLGHALTVAIQDALARWARMTGHRVTFAPGFDHAGIAAQMVVEKKLIAETGRSRHEIGREEFIRHLNEWANERAEDMSKQLVRLGASFDDRFKFYTLSPKLSTAVQEAFIRLFENGLVYRDKRLVNWSFYLRSTLADIEVKHVSVDKPTELTVPGLKKPVLVGLMHKIKYFIEPNTNSTNDSLTVSTTRPETIVGDVAVAVNPTDTRFTHLIGRRVVNPLTNSTMPIIGDRRVKPELGSGVLKVTPGHDLTDFEIGLEHSLPSIDIFDKQGHFNCPQVEALHGLDRSEARVRVIELLQESDHYLGADAHQQAIPMCPRSGDLIELVGTSQWFVKSHVVADKAMELIDRGELELIPEGYRNVWKEWVKRQRDWCVSRQIWWGHRVPAWLVMVDGEETDVWIAAKSEEEALRKLPSQFKNRLDVSLSQDPDVLDTWFSSGLLPLAVFGWPDETRTLNQHFPLSLMETGHDIIFFWVARMVILSLLLQDQLPFKKVLLHAMVCDGHGKKMSKSKGNVIDPIDVIGGASLDQLLLATQKHYKNGQLTGDELTMASESVSKLFPKGIPECGADALRLALLEKDVKAQRIDFVVGLVDSNRRMVNKMHQTVAYFMAAKDKNGLFERRKLEELVPELTAIDGWVVSCLLKVIQSCEEAFRTFDFYLATRHLQLFWVDQLCDVYLECTKPIVYHGFAPDKNRTLTILLYLMTTSLRLLHPFVPFVTEELYQRLKYTLNPEEINSPELKSISQEPYPTSSETAAIFGPVKEELIQRMDSVMEMVTMIRRLKAKYIKSKKADYQILIAVDDSLNELKPIISRLALLDVEFVGKEHVEGCRQHFIFPFESGFVLAKMNRVPDVTEELVTVEDWMKNKNAGEENIESQ